MKKSCIICLSLNGQSLSVLYSMENLKMEMVIVSPGGKKVNAFFKGFTIKTDQSKAYGGDESAPEPFDMFLVSIGTCVGANALVFCQKRDIPTKNLRLILQF